MSAINADRLRALKQTLNEVLHATKLHNTTLAGLRRGSLVGCPSGTEIDDIIEGLSISETKLEIAINTLKTL